jgi:hypothetical protein
MKQMGTTVEFWTFLQFLFKCTTICLNAGYWVNAQQMRQTFRNQTASIIFIYVERFGRYEFSNGPLQFEILTNKAPQIKNYGR